MPSKHGQRRLRSTILGDGLLERARSTTLALLGVTGAVGLAMVALVLNQGWPLIASGPVPPLPPRHQDVGQAVVAAGPNVGDAQPEPGRAKSAARPKRPEGEDEHRDESSAPVAVSAPVESAGFVVAPSAPVKAEHGHSKDDASAPSPAPVAPQPQPASTTPAEPAPAEAESSPPRTPPTDVPVPAPPTATASEVPTESYVPSWSNGHGHAYGRSDTVDSGPGNSHGPH